MKRIVLVGQPNCGKSTIFNHLVGFRAKISNLPGTTVKIEKGKFKLKDKEYEIIDLPGIYSLTYGDEAENTTLKFLLEEPYDVIVNILDATLLARGLELTIQLLKLGKPMIVVLNMMDEAKRKGIKIDSQKLSRLLKVPVIEAIGIRGIGLKELFEIIETLRPSKQCYIEDLPEGLRREAECIKNVIKECKPELNECMSYFLATKIIAREIEYPFEGECVEKINKHLKHIGKKIEAELGVEIGELFHAIRHHTAMRITEEVVHREKKRTNWTDRIDRILMHNVFGYLAMVLIYGGFFYFAFKIGGYLEEIFTKPFEYLYLNSSNFLATLWNAFIDGLSGGIGIVLPYLIPIMLFISILEDIGYIPRAAYLIDTLMHKIGLHGKSVVPLLLGYGCSVPAITATRIIEEERNRVLTALLVPFIPCSARLTVLLAISNKFLGPEFALGVLGLNLLVVGVVGKILSHIKKEETPGIILEIPSYRVPSLKITFQKTWLHIKEFLFIAWPMLIIGSMLLGIIQYFHWDMPINTLFKPITTYLLGLPEKVGVTLVFGIMRKELTLVMLQTAFNTTFQNLHNFLTYGQMAVFTVFTIFYIPCVATLAAIWKEFNLKIMLYSILLSISVATLMGILTRLFFTWV